MSKKDRRSTITKMVAKLRGIPENEVVDMQRSTSTLATTAGSVASLEDTNTLTNQDNNRKISLVRLTMEALPREEHYEENMKTIGRPSLGELHGEDNLGKDAESGQVNPEEDKGHGGHVKLGWIQGCLIQCMLNIWGVMLFLRLSWIVGEAGILESLLVVAVSTVVCVITTLSLSAICTNGEVKGGGIYYIISRSLGPEFGAAIGIVFAFANAVAASMNTIGFCSSLNELMKNEGYKIIDNANNDIRVVGVIALALMCVICIVGMDWEVLANDIFMVVISGAILDFLIGAAVGPRDDEARAKGFIGFNKDVFTQNLGTGYKYSEGMDQNIITVFAIFFPSVTGIQAGANISGDLKDAAEAIPKGTLLSILITMISYAVFVVFAGGAALREASGVVEEYHSGTFDNCTGRIESCQYGLINSYSIMQLMSLWGPLIYAGCFAATLSTALTNVLSVPKILQALGNDGIYPGLKFLAKGYFKSQEPVRAYILTYFISAGFLLIADLNAIAPLISNFYLASYGMINFCTFHAAHVKPLGWRPTFRFYNKWVSLLGCILCVVIMFIISWVTSLITFIIVIGLYLLVVYRKPDVNWGSSSQAMTYKTALQSAHHLNNILDHVKNYRPQILVMCGKPQHRPPLMDLAYLITKHNSLLVCGDVSQKPLSNREREAEIKSSYKYLNEKKIKAFYSLVDGIDFEQGAKALIQTSGIGKLKPNVLMMGYKTNWQTCDIKDLKAYFHILHEAFDNRLSVAIVRLPEGINYTRVIDDEDDNSYNLGYSCDSLSSPRGIFPVDSNLNLNQSVTENAIQFSGFVNCLPPDSPDTIRNYSFNEKTCRVENAKEFIKFRKNAGADEAVNKKEVIQIPEATILSMTFFRRKHKKEMIDVWWLYDDGGLTILMPYIISIRKNWFGSKLRIFALTNRESDFELEKSNMAKLLSKFRIDYDSLVMVNGISDKPLESTKKQFHQLLEGFMAEDEAKADCVITNSELASLKAKTDRQLRLRELLLEHSRDAGLVVMSLPMPRKAEVSAPLYMAWLEIITSDMPPFLLVRGNHTSVLTFAA